MKEIFQILNSFLYYLDHIVFFWIVLKYAFKDLSKVLHQEHKNYIHEEHKLEEGLKFLNSKTFANREQEKIQTELFNRYEKDILIWKDYKEKLRVENEKKIEKTEIIKNENKNSIYQNEINSHKIKIIQENINITIISNKKDEFDELLLNLALNKSKSIKINSGRSFDKIS